MDISTWNTLDGFSSISTQSLRNYEKLSDFNLNLNYWQRLTSIAINNSMTTPITHLHQQQSHPVRYFQIHKPSCSQYNSQIASHHLHQQQPQYNTPHYPQHYASTSTLISPDNSINLKKYEKNLSISYFANQSATKSTIPSQNITIKPLDDRQYNCQVHSVQNEIGHQPKYIITNGHSTVSPGEISFTTCFTLTNWIERLYPTIIHHNFNFDCLPLPSKSSSSSASSSSSSSSVQSIYTYRDYHAFGFVNIIEAVPDILKNIRPGTFIIRSTVISVSVGRNEKYLQRDDRNLIETLRQPVSNINSEFSIAINPRNWSLVLKRARVNDNKKNNNNSKQSEQLLEIERSFLIHNNCNNSGKNIINERLNNIHNQKTYADVLQDTRKYNLDKLKNMEACKELTSSTMNDKEKNESTATFIARAARRTSRGSSTDSGLCLDDSTTSESIDNAQISDLQIDDIDEQKSFNKIAEDFCFGPLLDHSSFLNVFDKYCQERKRMMYTNLLAEQSDNENINITKKDNSNVYTTNLLNEMANHNGINSIYFDNQRHPQQDQQQWQNNNLHNKQCNDEKTI